MQRLPAILSPCMDDEDLNRGNIVMNGRNLKFPPHKMAFRSCLRCVIKGLTLVCE